MKEFLSQAARVCPSQRQLNWYALGSYAFVHFGVNTFTDREWGDGREPEEIFNPTDLDCDQWVSAIKSAGMQGMVLTAKHHDGFCLWPSAYTAHSVKNSPCKKDVVKEAAEACKRGGIKFGVYLSPWDRNSALYGTPAYNDYFCNQLTELLTGYGEIFYVWFDNACGEGPNGKRQEYDFPRYFELIRKLQPGAVIFNDFGPDVRWCGNEAGVARHAEWAVVPSELCFYSNVQTPAGPLAGEGSLSFLYNTDAFIGTLPNILYSKGLTFTPAEINLSIRPGWFYHANEKPHSLERLFQVYLTSYGANACMHLNLPPNREGKIDEQDVQRLAEFGALLQKEFGTPLAADITKEENAPAMQPIYHIHTKAPVRYLELQEDLTKGQRVESFRILTKGWNGEQYPAYQGTCIGNRKICMLQDPFALQNPLIAFPNEDDSFDLTLQVTAARGEVFLKEIKVY